MQSLTKWLYFHNILLKLNNKNIYLYLQKLLFYEVMVFKICTIRFRMLARLILVLLIIINKNNITCYI